MSAPQTIRSSFGPAEVITLGVLPFGNLSGDPGRNYFSLGVTEEVLTALSRLPGLRVTARTSSFSLQGKDLNAKEIGTLLGVQYLLEGSVREAGGRVRIVIRLIEAENGFEVFTETFQAESEDVFELQDAIAASVAERMLHRLPAAGGWVPHGEVRGEAFETFLEGKFLYNQGNPEAVLKSIRKFEVATEISPDFPQAWAALSVAYGFLRVRELLPPNAGEEARQFAENALRLAPELPDAWLALGQANFYTWRWDETRKALWKAIELGPGMAQTHRQYARYLGLVARHEQALAELDLALRLDPLSLDIQNARVDALIQAGQLQKAVAAAKEILKKHPEYRSTLNNLGTAYMHQADYDRAIETFELVRELTGDPRKGVTQLGMAYAAAGRMKDAAHMLELLEERARVSRKDDLLLDFAGLNLVLGRRKQALFNLQQALAKRHPLFPLMINNWYLRELRSEPDYQQIYADSGLKRHIESLDHEVRFLTLKAETREVLTLEEEKLICVTASDNYSEVIWLEGGRVRRHLLRITLGQLAEQLPSDRFIRVHRSHLISLAHPFRFQGTLKQAYLTSPHLPESLPVSRARAREVRELLATP